MSLFQVKVKFLLVILLFDCFFVQVKAQRARGPMPPSRKGPPIPVPLYITVNPRTTDASDVEQTEEDETSQNSTQSDKSSNSLAPGCSQLVHRKLGQPLIGNFVNQTCQNRCKGMPGYRMPKDYISHGLCSCDEGCKVYGDCCFDFESECHPVASENEAQVQYMGCIAVQWRPPETYEPQVVLGITKCPHGYSDELTKRLCEEDSGWKYKNQTAFEASIAVIRRGVIYKNIFCATCSGTESKSKALEESIFKEISISCARRLTETMTLQLFAKHCVLIPHGSDDVVRRVCNSNATAILHQKSQFNCSDDEANQLCYSYSSPVMLSNGKVLSNVFCHKCPSNQSELSDTEISECLNGMAVIFPLKPPRESYHPVDLPSFAMLMDFVGALKRSPNSPSLSIPGLENIQCHSDGYWSDELEAEVFPSLCRAERSDECCWKIDKFREHINKLDSIYWKYELVIAADSPKSGAQELSKWMPCDASVNRFFGSKRTNASVCPSNDPLGRNGERFDSCWMDCFDVDWEWNLARIAVEKAAFACVEIGEVERINWWLSAFSVPFGNWSHPTLMRSGNATREATFTLVETGTRLTLEVPMVIHFEKEKGSEYVLKSEFALECDMLAIWKSHDLSKALSINTSLSYVQLSHDTALVCMSQQPYVVTGRNIEGMVTLVCQVLSMSSLLVTLFVYAVLPSLRNPSGCCLICLALSLLIAQALLQFGWMARHIPWLCIGVAATTHCAWLMAFSWMVILAFDISVIITRHTANKQQSRFRRYLGLAVTGPVVFVLCCLVVGTTRPDLLQYTDDDGICWISSSLLPRLLLFAVPVTCALVANAAFFTRTLMAIREAKKAADRSDLASQTRCSLIIYVRLASLMGFTWVFGLLQNAIPAAGLMRYAFIVCNALQGVYIMLSLVFKRRVLKLLKDRFKKDQPDK